MCESDGGPDRDSVCEGDVIDICWCYRSNLRNVCFRIMDKIELGTFDPPVEGPARMQRAQRKGRGVDQLDKLFTRLAHMPAGKPGEV